MKKWAIGIAKKDIEIVEVDESREKIVELSDQYKSIPRAEASVFILRAEFDGNEKCDNKMEFFGLIN